MIEACIPADPYKPPAISMFTPSGRFKTNTQLCMSMTNYHPESWNPMWSVGTILNGLLSFMQESAVSTGSISASREMRQQLAQESLQWNATNLTFKKLFPDYMELAASRSRQEAAASSPLEAPAQASGSQPHAATGRPQPAQVGTGPQVPWCLLNSKQPPLPGLSSWDLLYKFTKQHYVMVDNGSRPAMGLASQAIRLASTCMCITECVCVA